MNYVYHVAFSYSVKPRTQPGIIDNSPPRTNFGDTTITLNREIDGEDVIDEVRRTIRMALESDGVELGGVSILNWNLLSTEGEQP